MKISIVIPVYNAEKTIERLLDSIIIQTYKNYEVIVIDDGSTDKTNYILSKYKTDNIKIISKMNEGVGKARKIGFQNVIGDLVFFCDSDDYLPNKNVLQKINNKFENNDIDVLMFDVLNITARGKKIVNCFSENVEYGMHNIEEINKLFLFGPLFLKIFKTEKLDDNCFVEFNNFEDTYTTYKYLNKCSNFYYERDIYYVFDETANIKSLTKIQNIDKFISTIDLIESIYNESKLKESCCLSAFNYYLYLISLIQKHQEWDKTKIEELKLKMNKLEQIFLSNFSLIQNTQSKEYIKKYIQYKYNTKIVLVDGMSTTGKSTISDKLYNVFIQNGIKTKWLHEESLNEINLGLNLPKHENIDNGQLKIEMDNLYDRWKLFYKKIKSDDITYILDSNFFKNIHDHMLCSNLSFNEIKEYYNKLIDIFEKDKINIIFLKRENIKKSFDNAFKNRGLFWEKHYKKHVFEKTLSFLDYSDSNKFYKYEQIYQDFIESLFDQFKINKMKLITDDEKWNEYVEIIVRKLGLCYFSDIEQDYDYNKYIGNYSCENWDIEIFYDEKKKKLCLSAFWPNIELKYISNDTFKLEKFPLRMQLYDNKILFTGDLIWDMKNKPFVKINSKTLKK